MGSLVVGDFERFLLMRFISCLCKRGIIISVFLLGDSIAMTSLGSHNGD